ncbi:hypothetical protein DIPPA_23485 [Diplonema papillatum]|nr:hypothetical protein DIPPA_23485 [Diplonema papillatum]
MLRHSLRAGVARAVSPAAAAYPWAAQRRGIETEPTDIMSFKKGDYLMYEGVIHRVKSRNTVSTGRAAAQGKMMAEPLSGARRGQVVELHALKYDRCELKRAKLMFDHVDEDKDVLVVQEFVQTPDRELEAVDKFYELSAEQFEDLIDGGEGCTKWLTPDMVLGCLVADDEIIDIKMPPTGAYTVAAVSQVGGKWMALIEENDVQIPIDSPHGKPGDKIVVNLPRGRFVRLDK